MIKKIALLSIFAVAFLIGAPSALAFDGSDWNDLASFVRINNLSAATANTGGNSQSNLVYTDGDEGWLKTFNESGSRNITTGRAEAYAESSIHANIYPESNSTWGFWGMNWHHDDSDSTRAYVDNAALADAQTGSNLQDNVVRAGEGTAWMDIENDSVVRNITTGEAWSHAHAWTVLNTGWSMAD